jgi:hypothetical protein
MLAPLGELDAECLGGFDRVVEEQLEEVAHAIEQEGIGMGGLDAGILRHHRRHRLMADADDLHHLFRDLGGGRRTFENGAGGCACLHDKRSCLHRQPAQFVHNRRGKLHNAVR